MPKETADFGSSNLESAEYDTDTEVLSITFLNGSTYEYSSVPQAIWSGLRSAGSAGAYFHRAIKLRFNSEQV